MDLFTLIFQKKYTPTDTERIIISTLNSEEIKRVFSNSQNDMEALKSIKRYLANVFNAQTKTVVNIDRLAMLCYKKYYKDRFEAVDLDFVEI